MKRMERLCITLMAVGFLLAASSPAAWAAPERSAVRAEADGVRMPVLSGFWAEVQTAWRQALAALLGASASVQPASSDPSEPASSLDGGPTCQEVGTWAGCAADPNG
ncbi:MAG TPA: hypothetical protein VM599_04280 [Thermoanaerobaculia bacterium]|nr:hypothetical protein [Thermoanaerobaculia bacterium]